MSPPANELRLLGPLEQYMNERIENQFNAVVVVAIRLAPEPTILELKSALVKIVKEQPFLGANVARNDAGKAYFYLLPEVDLDTVVIDRRDTDYNSFQHEFPTMAYERNGKTPLWRLFVLSDLICFAYDHTIGDGFTGVLFQKELVRALDELADKPSAASCVAVPQVPFVDNIEKIMGLSLPWYTLIKLVIEDKLKPTVFTRFKSMRPRTAFTCNYQLSYAKLTTLRKIARSRGITLHSLLIPLLAQSVAPFAITEEDKNRPMAITTPVNARRYMDPKYTAVPGNFVCSNEYITSLKVNELETYSQELAKEINTEIKKSIENKSTLTGVAALGWVDVAKYIFDTLRKGVRIGTFELSNLGSCEIKSSKYSVEELRFIGGVGAFGPPFCFTTISSHNGPLNIAINTAVEEDGAIILASLDKLFDKLLASA